MKNKWVLQVFLISFVLSLVFSGLSSYLADFNLIIMLIVLLLVIAIGILFDMIGVAVLTASEAPFHAKSSKKIKGAKMTLWIIKNSTKVSSICNDIVGDICGIVSGTLGASLTLILVVKGMNALLASMLITALVSSLTIGGKAFFKTIATKKSEDIVWLVGKALHFVHK